MSTMIALPKDSPFANNWAIRPFNKDWWETPHMYQSSIAWHIIAKGNIIEGIEAKE